VPLLLLAFKVQLVKDDDLLNWATANENKTASFFIERSTEDINYILVGSIAAQNISGIHYYSFTDVQITKLSAEQIYYRLKQNDIDSRHSFSHKIIVQLKYKTVVEFLFYSNPATDQIAVTVQAEQTEKLQYSIVDNRGITV
jgi:hypothetical protein